MNSAHLKPPPSQPADPDTDAPAVFDSWFPLQPYLSLPNGSHTEAEFRISPTGDYEVRVRDCRPGSKKCSRGLLCFATGWRETQTMTLGQWNTVDLGLQLIQPIQLWPGKAGIQPSLYIRRQPISPEAPTAIIIPLPRTRTAPTMADATP